MGLLKVKTCSKCKQIKNVGAFYRESASKDGRRSECKDCKKKRDLVCYSRDIEKIKKNKAQYYKLNAEKIKAYKKQYRKANPQKVEACVDNSKAKKPEKYRKIAAKKAARMRREHPLKCAARRAIYDAIRRKEITRPTMCSNCPFIGCIEAHHEDYSKPFDVRWLCKSCHDKITYSNYLRGEK